MLRVVVIGAHRRRQGIGPHLARFVAKAGARVVGIVGTTSQTVTEALEALASLGLALAWLTGARSLAAPTMTLLLLVLLRLVISLGLPSISGFPGGLAGMAMMAGLAVSSILNLAEYGMLMFAVEVVVRRESA